MQRILGALEFVLGFMGLLFGVGAYVVLETLFCGVVRNVGLVCDFGSEHVGTNVRVLFIVLLGWGVAFVYLEWCLLAFCVCPVFRFVFVSLTCVSGEFGFVFVFAVVFVVFGDVVSDSWVVF